MRLVSLVTICLTILSIPASATWANIQEDLTGKNYCVVSPFRQGGRVGSKLVCVRFINASQATNQSSQRCEYHTETQYGKKFIILECEGGSTAEYSLSRDKTELTDVETDRTYVLR